MDLAWSGIRVLPLLAALSLLASGALRAQTLEGRVVDSRTGEPVASAYVALVTQDRRSVVASTADTDGSFSVEAPSPGSYLLHASALGYRLVSDGLFELGQGGVMEVLVRLRPDPVLMDSITATVSRTERYLRDVGFYERQQEGWGHHLSDDEVRQRGAITVVDVVRDIPRVYVAREGAAEVLMTPDRPYPDIVIRDGGHFCPPHIFVDGMLMHRGGVADRRPQPDGPAMPDEFVHPEDIAGMELYTGRVQVPARYNLPNTCGVLLIWTWH